MFDKIIVNRQSDRLVPYEKTVHEHRAPTDDSIKLYGEMLEKAYESILESFSIEANELNGVEAIITHDCQFGKCCMIHFKLNGKSFTKRLEIASYEDDYNKVLNKMVEDLATYISVEIIRPLIISNSTLTRQLFERRE